jgi:GPH family glycoside/pentoside/hexuronide:cation symporter
MNSEKEKLSGKRIFGYAVGAIPAFLIAGFFNLAYVNFFYDDLQLNETLWIIGLIIYMIVNAINDPLIGYLSDNTNVDRRKSRRLFYIKYFSPILVIVFIFIWIPWSLDNQIIIFLHFVIMICVYDTVLNIVFITWYALLPDMTIDIDERTKVGFIGNVVGFFASILTMIVPYIMNNRELLLIGSMIVAVIGIICYALVVKFSKESPEFQQDKSPPLLQSIKQTLTSKSFLYFLGYNFTATLSLSIGLSYLFVHSLILGEAGIIYFFLIYIFVGFSSNIICMKLRYKYGIKKIMVIFIILDVVSRFISFFIILIPAMEWFIWVGVVLTSFFGGSGVFISALISLPIDEDEIKFGVRREGMFYGVNAIFTMPAYSIGPIIATIILFVTNYVKDAPRIMQPASAILGIKFLFFVLPGIFPLIGFLFIFLYPAEKLESTSFQNQLKLLHKQKKEKIESISKE